MICGSVVIANSLQTGHTRSPYSVIVTGAPGLPSTLPDCGIPASSSLTVATAAARSPVLRCRPVLLPAPPELTAIATTSAMIAVQRIAPSRSRRRRRAAATWSSRCLVSRVARATALRSVRLAIAETYLVARSG